MTPDVTTSFLPVQFVELDKSYYKPGQTVQVQIGESAPISVIPSSAPFPSESNHGVLLKLRGDIPAGSTKLAQYGLSVTAPLDLHVTAASSDALYNLQPGQSIHTQIYIHMCIYV